MGYISPKLKQTLTLEPMTWENKTNIGEEFPTGKEKLQTQNKH